MFMKQKLYVSLLPVIGFNIEVVLTNFNIPYIIAGTLTKSSDS
jgi:hypothetical protein